MAQQQFTVDGLHCEGCAKTVTDALTKVSGVKSVQVDLNTRGTSTVRVEAESTLAAADVQAALDRQGNFTVVG